MARGQALLETGRSIDLPRNEQRAVEQERRIAPLHDLEARPFKRTSARGRDPHRIAARKRNPPPIPGLRMQEHRQIGSSELANESLHPADMVEVAVAQDDRLDVMRRHLQSPHVLNEAIWRDPGVEQDAMLPLASSEGHKRRKAVLCPQRVER